MNAKINLTKNNIALLENKLMQLAARLSDAIDLQSELTIKKIKEEIERTQQFLKDEYELLDELTN